MHNFIDKYAPRPNWGAAPFPHPADRPDLASCTNTEADILVIPNGAAHPDEAFKFIRYVNSQEGMELLCMGQRKHSPLTHVSPEFWVHHPNPYIRVFSDLARGRNTFATPKVGVWLEYRDELSVAFDKIWLGEETPAAALGQVQARMQPRFERELRRQQRLRRP
jgi:multiple sugar transport system substrate-binding protein